MLFGFVGILIIVLLLMVFGWLKVVFFLMIEVDIVSVIVSFV